MPLSLKATGILLVCGMTVFNRLTNDMITIEKDADFQEPILTIWMNHQFLLCNYLLGVLLFARRTGCGTNALVSPLAEVFALTNWTPKRAAGIATVLAFLYFGPNASWVFAIQLGVPISLNLALQQSQTVWVYLLSVLFLGAKFRYTLLVAVLLCLGGVGLIVASTARSESGDPHPAVTLSSVLLALAQPVGVSIFSIIFKRNGKWAINIERTCTYTAMIGAANTTLLIPIVGTAPGAPQTLAVCSYLLCVHLSTTSPPPPPQF